MSPIPALKPFAGTKAAGSQGGFSLVEMLVATLVLAFGLIGLAGLQATSLRNNTSAYHRTQVNLFTQDMIDRMRANRAQAVADDYHTGGFGDPAAGGGQAATDVTQWYALLATLPNGQGQIICDTGVCQVSVQWSDAGSLTTYTISTQL